VSNSTSTETFSSPKEAMDILSKPITLENYSPIYGIFGKDHFLMDRALKIIRKPFLDAPMGDLNHEKFDLKEVSAQKIVSAANSVPMLGSNRLIEVKNAETVNAKDALPLLEYIRNPNKTTCLILMGESADKKKKLIKELVALKLIKIFNPGNKRSIQTLIKTELSQQGFSISSNVAALISEFIGEQDIGLALQKIVLYKGSDKNIKEEDVLLTIGSSAQAAVFSFVDLLFERRLQKSLEQLKLLFDNQESPILIVTLLARQLRFVLFSKATNGGLHPKAPPFLRSKLATISKGYNYAQLYNCHSLIYNADKSLKSSRADRLLLLESVVFSWCMD
jgi:DNA polymerase III subunit delta